MGAALVVEVELAGPRFLFAQSSARARHEAACLVGCARSRKSGEFVAAMLHLIGLLFHRKMPQDELWAVFFVVGA